MTIQEGVTTLFLAAGVFFLVVAAIGFVRLPDIFCRLHVIGVIDTLGAPLILLGAAVHVGPHLTAGKLVLGIAFMSITSPLVGHLLARAALEADPPADLAGASGDNRPAPAPRARGEARP